MWRRFTTTMADVQQQPNILPEMLCPQRGLLNAFSFGRAELEYFEWLFSVAPCYPVKANGVKVIKEPEEFYATLAERCGTARKRIVLSSLYLGTGALEKNLVSIMHKNLMSSRTELKINVLLDYQRGSRGVVNSRTMLLPLLEGGDRNCQISLYHTPKLRGLYKRWLPERWNELIELQHMKVYLMDDTVIISGANLSNDYFTNRQDRYILIEDKDLADFYADLVSRVQSVSFRLRKDGSVAMAEDCPNPHTDDKAAFVTNARNKIVDLFRSSMALQETKGQKHISDSDTWIIPLVQAGGLDIKMDSETTKQFFTSAPPSSLIRIATGYFNLTHEYIDALTNKCLANCTLLMAHPNANGFKGARGPAGGVPDAYSLLAQKFYNYVESFGQQNRFRLYEFEKAGWTYHGKGLWYYPTNHSHPTLTFIGSPNFGERSVNRDLETQIILVTTNDDLKRRLHEECSALHESSKESRMELFQRRIPNWVKMTVGLFRNFF